ncbi:MAG: MFS transporter [Nocardioidaceae bacterium]|nr:MFS transporter [Nocardioidaceae bacterium]NUS50837.1 MFS transporter [Nocardioidaceae bacterium]
MTPPSRLGGRRALLVWGSSVAVYFLAIFHRSSLGVAGLAAADRFDITAAQLSTFTVLQLGVYAAMQIPVGVLLDRFGPQRLLIAGTVFMTAAQLGFAVTGTYAGALAARVFVGIGDAMVFISVLRLIASWFPPMRSPLLTAFTAMLGQCGALVAAIPLSHALSTYGWTATFAVSASSGVVLGLLVVLLVRDVPPGAPPSRVRKDVRTVGRDLRLAWLDPGTRLGLWSHFTTQFAANVLGLLWGYPFFVNAEHCAAGEAAALLSLLVGVFIVGGPLIGGYITRHPWRRSTIVLGIVGTMATVWTVVLLYPGDAPLWLLAVLVVVTGIGGPGSMIGFDLARTFAPASRLGQASGIVNVGGFTASLLAVLAIGLVLDAVTPGSSTDYSPAAYRIAMSVQYVGWVAGGFMVWRYRYRARVHLADTQPDTFRAMSGLDSYDVRALGRAPRRR